MNKSGTMQVLVVTSDSPLMTNFIEAFKDVHVEAYAGQDPENVAEQLNEAKYEGLVVDFDTVLSARSVIANVRASRSNNNAIIFAIATDALHTEQALQDRAHFLLRRPVELSTIRQTLSAAYDLMIAERRSHFRCAVELPVLLTITGSRRSLECLTINVSSNGMAVRSPAPFQLAEPLDVVLFLPNGFAIHATGIVIWDDKHGKSGLHFHCRTPEMRHELDAWLDSLFAASLDETPLA